MLADAPIWSAWTDHLPNRPLATDVFADGVHRRPRDEALQYAHIEFNTAGKLNWFLFDSDTDESFECWERAGLPEPNFYAQNRGNGHGHLGYCLKTPVGLLGLSREGPIALAADVQRGMTRRLGADPAYANRLGKNPAHGRWGTSWYAAKPYELRELLEALDRRDLKRPTTLAEVSSAAIAICSIRCGGTLTPMCAPSRARPAGWMRGASTCSPRHARSILGSRGRCHSPRFGKSPNRYRGGPGATSATSGFRRSRRIEARAVASNLASSAHGWPTQLLTPFWLSSRTRAASAPSGCLS
jgi:hypothetical protein